MTWLWTDTLAALLVEHDQVAPEALTPWVRRPIGIRLPDGVAPLDLARTVLLGDGGCLDPLRRDADPLSRRGVGCAGPSLVGPSGRAAPDQGTT